MIVIYHNYNSLIFMLHVGLEDMIRVYAHLNNFQYDAMIVIRPDTAMLRDIDLPKVSKASYIHTCIHTRIYTYL